MIDKNQQGFIGLLLLIIIVIAGVAIYSFMRTVANEHGFELPF